MWRSWWWVGLWMVLAVACAKAEAPGAVTLDGSDPERNGEVCALPGSPNAGCPNLCPAPDPGACASLVGADFRAAWGEVDGLSEEERKGGREAASARDEFERSRLEALCVARVASPCDPALALALDSALRDHREAVASAAKPEAVVAFLDDAGIHRDHSDKSASEPANGAGGSSPPAPPTMVAMERLERYPRIIAPSAVTVQQRVTALVGLAMKPTAASIGTQVIEGDTTAAGGLVLDLPPLPANVETWTIDVLLAAPGFSVKQEMAQIQLPRVGDSTFARFDLTLEAAPSQDTLPINAYLYFDGSVIGQIARTVLVNREAGGTVQVVATTGGSAVVGSHGRTHDINLLASDAHTAMVMLGAPGQQPSFAYVPFESGALGGFLGPKWGLIRESSRGLDIADPNPTGTSAVRGLGLQLWDLVPGPVRDHILRAWDDDKVESLRIFTNVPAFPWELVEPVRADGSRLEPLGSRFRIGRWHTSQGAVVRALPPLRLPFDELVALMPAYGGPSALPALEREKQALSKVAGFRLVEPRVSGVMNLLRAPPNGIVHFAGHGVAAERPGASTAYAIQLEDGALDALAFRGMPDNQLAQSRTLVFFNACEVGQSSTTAGLVEGWAPAMLDAGAAGYIGALWPVGDARAAEFAASFYGEVERSIAGTGEARVTDVLRCLRRRGVSEQDPTWQAYVFYGDPETVLYRDGGSPSGQPYRCAAG